MKSMLRTLFLPLLMGLAIISFGGSIALADDGGSTATTTPANLAALWPMVGLFIATFAGWGIPKLAAAYSFFHTALGAVIIGLIGALIGAVIPVLQSGHVTWIAIVWAVVSGGTAFFARLNPSTTSEDPPAKSPSARPGATMLLPLVFMAAMTLPLAGCPGPGTDVLKKCELGQLPAIEQSVLAEVGVVILNPASVLADLVALAAQLGPGQVACAVQAWDAYLASKQPSSVGGLMAATSTDQRAHALSLTRAFLAGHPATACSANMRAGLDRSTADAALITLMARRPDIVLGEIVASASKW